MLKKRIKIASGIIVAIILICVGIFIYRSYNHSYKLNDPKNSFAKSIYNSTCEALEKSSENVCEDMIISDNDNFNINSKNFKDELLEQFDSSLSINKDKFPKDPDYKKGVYYIEIRNGKVYKVIYANWKYSGYAGKYPDCNLTCKPYNKLAKEAYEDFNKYLNEKKDSENED